MHLRSATIPNGKEGRMITGDQFESVILKGNKHCAKLILVTHPKNSKNVNIQQDFSKIATNNSDDKLIMATYPGVNESAAFKIT